MDAADIQNRFTYHPPNDLKIEKHQAVREDALSLAESLNVMLPEGREKSLAITKLEECAYWANAVIARNPDLP